MSKKAPATRRKPTQDTPTNFNAFLKPENLAARGPSKLVLTGWARRLRSKFGEQIAVEVTHEGTTYDFAFKDGSPNHRALFKAFGNQHESAWKQGTITVEVQGGKFGKFISIIEVESDEAPF